MPELSAKPTGAGSPTGGVEVPYAIEVEHIVKKYGDFTAVDNVSFNVRNGEIFGLLGPNGAGKSTLIRMMTTLIPITAGAALLVDAGDQPRQGNALAGRRSLEGFPERGLERNRCAVSADGERAFDRAAHSDAQAWSDAQASTPSARLTSTPAWAVSSIRRWACRWATSA